MRLRPVDATLSVTPALAALLDVSALDPGEEEALRLMQEVPEAILLTDDDSARTAAKYLKYEVHGTVGVLLLGWERGRRSKRQVLSLLKAVRTKSTLHISEKLLSAIIAQVQARSS